MARSHRYSSLLHGVLLAIGLGTLTGPAAAMAAETEPAAAVAEETAAAQGGSEATEEAAETEPASEWLELLAQTESDDLPDADELPALLADAVSIATIRERCDHCLCTYQYLDSDEVWRSYRCTLVTEDAIFTDRWADWSEEMQYLLTDAGYLECYPYSAGFVHFLDCTGQALPTADSLVLTVSSDPEAGEVLEQGSGWCVRLMSEEELEALPMLTGQSAEEIRALAAGDAATDSAADSAADGAADSAADGAADGANLQFVTTWLYDPDTLQIAKISGSVRAGEGAGDKAAGDNGEGVVAADEAAASTGSTSYTEFPLWQLTFTYDADLPTFVTEELADLLGHLAPDTGEENLCTTTVILAPGTDQEQTFRTTTLKGDPVSVLLPDGYDSTLCTDAACTQPWIDDGACNEDVTLYAPAPLFRTGV